MKGIHVVIAVLFAAAAFIAWRLFRSGNGAQAIRSAQTSTPIAFDTSPSGGGASGACHKVAQINGAGAGAIGKIKGAPPIVSKVVGSGASLMVDQFCVAGSLLGKVGKPVIHAVESGVKTGAKAIGKGTKVAVKATYGAIKSGALGTEHAFKAALKSPTALAKSAPVMAAIAPPVVATKVAVSTANKVANLKVPTAALVVAAPIIVPTKVAAKAVTTTAKAASKVASGAKNLVKKLF